MPELPEAENIRRALDKAMTGRTVTGVEVFTPAMREPLTPLLNAALPGRKFTCLRRRGRYVIAEMDDGRALLMHFGMSGVVRIEPLSIPKRKHEHVFLHLDNGKAFRFECTRRFSLLKVVTPPAPGADPEELSNLGIEPLTDAFNGEYLYRRSRRCGMPVKGFIMDNAAVTGIGNIYATESLFSSGISPLRPASGLTEKECAGLCQNIKIILNEAISMGGSTISDFLNVDGSEGKFAQKLRIYGKAGSSCPVCGTMIEAVKIGGRTSAYCPRCQH